MPKHKVARREPKHKHHTKESDVTQEDEEETPMAVASEYGAPGSGFAGAMQRILGKRLAKSSPASKGDEEVEEAGDEEDDNGGEGGAGSKRKRDMSRAERKARAKARKVAEEERAARVAAAASGSGSGVILAKRKTKQLKLIAEARKEAREAKKKRKAKLVLAARSTPLVVAEFTEKERQLRKVATQGVVALFNAIKEHQGLLKSGGAANGGTEERDDRRSASAVADSITNAKAASGDDFLDMLRDSGAGAGKEKKKEKKKAKKSKISGAAWMDGDYMMNSSMKGFSDALEGEDDD